MYKIMQHISLAFNLKLICVKFLFILTLDTRHKMARIFLGVQRSDQPQHLIGLHIYHRRYLSFRPNEPFLVITHIIKPTLFLLRNIIKVSSFRLDPTKTLLIAQKKTNFNYIKVYMGPNQQQFSSILSFSSFI